jgi:hypothetical protein
MSRLKHDAFRQIRRLGVDHILLPAPTALRPARALDAERFFEDRAIDDGNLEFGNLPQDLRLPAEAEGPRPLD